MGHTVDDNGKDLLSVEELAEYLGVNPATIYRWCREVRLPYLKLGRLWRFRRASLEDLLGQEEQQRSADNCGPSWTCSPRTWPS